MRLIDKDALEEAVQGSINIMESHGISMIATSVPFAIIKGAPTIDAIPVEWLRNVLEEAKEFPRAEHETIVAIPYLIKRWQKEQEAHGT